MGLQDEPRQVRVLGQFAYPLAHIIRVDDDFGAARLVGGGEADLFEQTLENRVQTAGADILDGGIDLLSQ